MTAVEIEAKLNEFNKELDALTQKLGINIPLNSEFDQNNVPILVPSTDVDQLISFETKVTYFHDYFEQKCTELNLWRTWNETWINPSKMWHNFST